MKLSLLDVSYHDIRCVIVYCRLKAYIVLLFFVGNTRRLFGHFANADFRQIRPRNVNRG